MKQWIWAAALTTVLAWPAAAADLTLAEKSDVLESTLYGQTMSGALTTRLDELQYDVYGGTFRDAGLSEQVETLYDDVIKSDTNEPSLAIRLHTLEWQLQNQVTDRPIIEIAGGLERTVYGALKTGALRTRVKDLEETVYRGKHYELKQVEVPAGTVFKISLAQDVGTKLSQEGDTIRFTVSEDVFVDDVLVLPKGSMGHGEITKVKQPKRFGRNGEIKIAFNQVFGIADEPIATVLGPEAQERLKREAAAVGASAVGAMVLGPIGLVGGYFVRGTDVDMPAGTELYIQVQDTVAAYGVAQVSGAPTYTARDIVISSAAKEKKARPADGLAVLEEKLSAPAKADSTVDADGVNDAATDAVKADAKAKAETVKADAKAKAEAAKADAKAKAEASKADAKAKAEASKADAKAKADAAKADAKAKADAAKSNAVVTEEEPVKIERIETDDDELPVVIIRQES